jgi:phosphoribosylamine--glycine ligase
MRFLGVGKGNDCGDIYLRLQQRGHEVRVFVEDPEAHDIMEGMLTFTANWRDELEWIRRAGSDGIIIFEGVGWGETQDALRREGFQVVGGSAFGDRLEQDRSFGQEWMHRLGMHTAAVHEFSDFAEAIEFVERARQRFVLKFSGHGFASTRNYVGVMEDGADVAAVLRLQRSRWTYDEPPRFILMDHVSGVEVGVGAFFNGERFLDPPNLDWEHKRFFPGDLGELTGEMGTLATYRGARRLFDATLGRSAPALAASGYCGYVNLNMILNAEGVWPLEFTCRFGYPGYSILDSLHEESWDSIFSKLCRRDSDRIATRDGYSVCVVLTVPSFPYYDGYERLSKGAPILFRSALSEEEREQLHFAEVRLEGGQLVTAGSIGYIMVVTGLGARVEDARSAAYHLAERVVIPNLRYRCDIGEKFLRSDREEMIRLGWLA